MERVQAAFARRGRLPATGHLEEWHYWWQAHHIDAVIDAAWRFQRGHELTRARAALRRARHLVYAVRVRNHGRIVNRYYDDMAWMALAVQRLGVAEAAVFGHARPGFARTTAALVNELVGAHTDHLGGGLFWNDERDFKNTPATAPAAIWFARAGQQARARALVEWLYARLWDADSGLIRDGIRVDPDGSERVVGNIYTYNQGIALGALLALGEPHDRERAAALIAAVDRGLVEPDTDGRVLVTHGGGDGGLFTGILARYLALAATTTQMDPEARTRAATLVRDTADALWRGRDTTRGLFSPRPTLPAAEALPPGSRIELSCQVQAWTVLEAVATLPLPGPPPTHVTS